LVLALEAVAQVLYCQVLYYWTQHYRVQYFGARALSLLLLDAVSCDVALPDAYLVPVNLRWQVRQVDAALMLLA
jgi:hypothetical protein